ncbi:hypothetical protein F4781DRAFT_445006 [Annulohypoxylon bovei var. microspora]|nr:hypothetical protein F4781DRAFT_445006 [Annulohypoxylon bovei var. microspora]
METSYNDATTKSLKTELLEAIKQLPLQTGDFPNKPKDLENVIQKWISSAQKTPGQAGELLHLLEESSDTDLSTDSLIESSLMLFRYLRSLESRYRFNVFIAQAEKQEIGSTYDHYSHAFSERDESEDEGSTESDKSDSIEETYWTLRVMLFNDNELRKPYVLEMSPGSILQGDVFKDTDPNDEDVLSDDYGHGSTWPECYRFCRYYRSSALFMIPQATTATYFLDKSKVGDDYTAADLLEYFSSKCSESEGGDKHLETLTSLCELFFPRKDVKSKSRMDVPEPIIVKILEAAMICQSQTLFDLVWNNNEADLSPQFFVWISERLRDSSMLPLTMLISALDHSFSTRDTLGDRYRYVKGLQAVNNKAPRELEAHVLHLFDQMVDLCYSSVLYEQDGEILVFIACERRDYDWLLKTLDPLIHKERENIAFILGFSWQLYASISQNKLRVSDSFDWLKTTIKSLIARLDVSHLVSYQGFQCQQQNRKANEGLDENPIPAPPPPVTSQTLVNLCMLLLNLDMEEDLRDLARRLISQSGRIDPLEFVNLFVPFVGSLMDVLEDRSVSLEDPVLSSLVRTIIKEFWSRCVLPGEPIWRQPRYEVLDRCNCRFCKSMNSDLLNPKKKSWNVKESEPKLKRHIAQVLQELSQKSYCSHNRANTKSASTWYISKLPTKYEKIKSNWDQQFMNARAQLAAFNQNRLWQVLGPDYCYITGNTPPYSENPRTDVTMNRPSMGTQAPPLARPIERTEIMPRVALPPPNNIYGNMSSPHLALQHLVHDGLPSVAEISHMPVYHDEVRSHQADHGPPQQFPAVRAWPSGMPLPTAYPANPVQVPTPGLAQGQNRPSQMSQNFNMPQSQALPGRPTLAPFPQNLVWNSGPSIGQNRVAPAVAGLKREQDDDDILFISERPAKRPH